MRYSWPQRLRHGASWALAFGLALAAWSAAPASAAFTYYVSPGGSGSECTPAEPCGIVSALAFSTSGDTVVVAGDEGSYGLPQNPTLETFEVKPGVTIEGAPGQPRPAFYAAGVGHAFELGSGATMSSFEIHYLASPGQALFAQGSNTIERTLLEAPDTAACIFAPEVTLTDSVCAGEFGIFDFVGGGGNWPITLRNDTIDAGQVGLDLGSNGPALTVAATNTIVRGGNEDVFAIDQGNGGHVTVTFSHSNYANVKAEAGATVTSAGSGTNQTASPLLANTAGGDFHELAGSPTIDAGVNETANGPLDLDGNERALPSKLLCSGSEPAVSDIGAFEFVPAAPSCSPSGGSGGSTGAQGGASGGSSMASGGPGTSPVGRPDTRISKEKLDGNTISFKFKGSGTGPLHFECRLDKAKFTSCRSPITYRHLNAGRHRFRVRAVGAGGADSTPATRKFTVTSG